MHFYIHKHQNKYRIGEYIFAFPFSISFDTTLILYSVILLILSRALTLILRVDFLFELVINIINECISYFYFLPFVVVTPYMYMLLHRKQIGYKILLV